VEDRIPYYAATSDGWTSDAGDKYRDFTLHFFLPDTWELMSIVLRVARCGGKAPEIAEFLKETVDMFKLLETKLVSITTDTATVELAATALAGLTRLDCVNHILELVLKIVTRPFKKASSKKPERPKSPTYDLVITLQNFVTKERNAPLLKGVLVREIESYCRRKAIQKLPLPIPPVKTRWNTVSR
jgi:hypothetical protein